MKPLAARTLIFDAESADEANAIPRLVRELASLTAGVLTIVAAACVDADRERRLTITTPEGTFTARLEGDTDWMDLPPLVACLNAALAAAGRSERFYSYREPDWGQEAGVVFATDEEAGTLRSAGLLEE